MHEHESLVAEYCARFLKRIDPSLEKWGELLGRWHDLGKYSNEFQKYLATCNDIDRPDLHSVDVSGRVDHSTAAAKLAVEEFGDKGRLLAYPFAGHHAGLPDWDDGATQKGLKQRLRKDICEFADNAPGPLLKQGFPGMPSFPKFEDNAHVHERAAFRVAFWIRILFSGLVDADFLATEEFMSPHRNENRVKSSVSMSQLHACLEARVKNLESVVEPTSVNQIRFKVGAECLGKAELPPGIFSLNVPTGGGKTIASLRFATKHAVKNKLSRIIVAIPFTSIIEQNADVYRNIFERLGENVVLEHHSSLDPDTETTTNRLQAENWDAPLVVTTNVQFFESLFASKTSRCRKLHRIANSVIVLDEAQTLPVELLKPTMFAIQELVEVFNCTVVLCTATQPALNFRDDFEIGLKDVTPIIDDAQTLHESLKRVKVEFVGQLSDEQIAEHISDCEHALCIVNTRPHASKIYEMLDESDFNYHLSTRMCAAHRKYVLEEEIKPRLASGESCRVVSTQLIEAGVDIDFPVVYRGIAGLDSLAQAAGRCNREGRLDLGKVYFFDTELAPPPGLLRQTADSARELIELYDDLLCPEAIEHFFQLHYWKKSDAWDRYGVIDSVGNQPEKLQFNFREIAAKYQFIRDASESVIIPWDQKARRLIGQLAFPQAKYPRSFWRKLQRYSIQVRQHEFQKLREAGAVELQQERWVLVQSHLYDQRLGLVMSRADGVLPVEDLMV